MSSIKCKAAVAFGPKKPLEIVEIEVLFLKVFLSFLKVAAPK